MQFLRPLPVYAGHGNVIELLPLSDTRAQTIMDISGVTKIAVCVGGAEVVSSDEGQSVIKWGPDPEGQWTIQLKLGLIEGLEEGLHEVRIVLYSQDYPNGLVLTDEMPVCAVGECDGQ